MSSATDFILVARETLRGAILAHPYHAISIISLGGLLFLLHWLREVVLKPPHKKRRKDGSRYRLPPGPSGIPIIGNLLHFKDIRYDVDHKFVSPCSVYLTKCTSPG